VSRKSIISARLTGLSDHAWSTALKYEAPVPNSSSEILDILDREDTTPAQRIDAVLSAIFYGEDVAFSGDVLLKEFSSADYKRDGLKRLFETFYQSWGTTYRIDESIALLEAHKARSPGDAPETQEIIESLLETKTIFNGR